MTPESKNMDAMPVLLQDSYASIETAELLKLGIQPNLGDDDYAEIESVLSARGVDLSALQTQREQYAKLIAHGVAKKRSGLYRRAMAAVIDTLGIALFLAFAALVIVLFLPNLFVQTKQVLIMLLLAYILLKDGFNGQSLGKHYMHIRVVDAETGEPCNLPQSCLRNLLALTVIDWFFAFGSRQLRLGDMLAKTRVVREA